MPLPVRRSRSRARSPLRFVTRFLHMLLVAVAAGLGAPPPRPFRHEDPVVQVSEGHSHGERE